MDKQVITPEAMREIEASLEKGENWIVYNSIPYFLEKSDVFCFKDEFEAREFAQQTISEWDLMNVFHARSIGDVCKEITSLDENEVVSEKISKSAIVKNKLKEPDSKQTMPTPAAESKQGKANKKCADSLLPKKCANNKRGLPRNTYFGGK